jgi:DNA polymerase III epsilon subunit-like protein
MITRALNEYTARMVTQEVYLSVDVEADGPIPGPYSMLSFGAAVAGHYAEGRFEPADPTERTFYRELRPISDQYVAEALAVSGLDRDELGRAGTEPEVAMADFVGWVADAGARPVLVAYPISFDWMFLYWYLIRFTGGSPFGHSRYLDMKTMYATKAGVPVTRVSKGSMPRKLLPQRPHTHNALDDAIEQAELFANLMRWSGPRP